MKHKNDEKGRGGLLVYTRKKCKKHYSIYHLKSWKHPFYKGLRKKESIKIMKKEEEDIGVLKGSRTIINGYNPSVYKGLRRKTNKKRKKKKRRIGQQ